LDQGSEREVVKKVCEILPNVRVAVLSQAFIVKSITVCVEPINRRMKKKNVEGKGMAEKGNNNRRKREGKKKKKKKHTLE
jgi:hypothetical protein